MNFFIQKNKNTQFLRSNLEAVRKGDVDWLLLEGSSRSGKTWAILFFLISLALDPSALSRKRLTIRAYRQDATTTTDSIVADFVYIMTSVLSYQNNGREFCLFNEAGSWNKTSKTYTFNNGSTISFHGASEPQKLQGKKQDIAWFNEAMEISEDAAAQISMRTEILKIADWNPSLSVHWLFKLMERNKGISYCHSTYKDNCDLDSLKSNLTPQIIADIEKFDPSKPENLRSGTANQFKWNVYGLGLRGAREGQVFERINWDIIDDSDFPDARVCQRHGYGGDFGFSQDPTALIDCRLHNDAIYLKQLIYEKNLFTGKNLSDPLLPSIELRLEELEKEGLYDRTLKTIWDCADPRSIALLRSLGYNAHPCVKSRDSVLYGINLLKQFRIYICRSSQKIQTEFENYVWKKLPDGTFADTPEDANNHAIDAIRYWAMDALKPRAISSASYPRPKLRSLFDEF